MQIAVLLFDHVTALEAVGPCEVLGRLPGAEVVLVAEAPGPVRCDSGFLHLVAEASIEEVVSPEVVVVPGWSGARPEALLSPGSVREWLTAVEAHTSWTASVGTGSLALAAAGLLDGRRATTHWLAAADLAAFGVRVTDERVVRDGTFLTAAGATAGIDMALTLAELVGGAAIAQAIQLGIEYDPQPPHRCGSPHTAPPQVVSAMRALKDFILFGSS